MVRFSATQAVLGEKGGCGKIRCEGILRAGLKNAERANQKVHGHCLLTLKVIANQLYRNCLKHPGIQGEQNA